MTNLIPFSFKNCLADGVKRVPFSISKTSKASFLYLIFKISSDRTITLPPSTNV